MAFQKEHTGMQGEHYLDSNKLYTIPEFITILEEVFKFTNKDIIESARTTEDADLAGYIYTLLDDVENEEQTLIDWWLYCRDQAIKSAILMSSLGVTKQVCNRILEPFIYHTALVTSTEWEDFFELRCPVYEIGLNQFKSKEASLEFNSDDPSYYGLLSSYTDMDWLKINKGMGEIHIMDLAEKTWNAMNESSPDVLEDGQWHIPFGDNIDFDILSKLVVDGKDFINTRIKIATARAARISYESLGDTPVIDYEKDIKLHDDLLVNKHMSPFEHIGRAMTTEEYVENIKGKVLVNDYSSDRKSIQYKDAYIREKNLGWSRNLHGFIQYREIVEQNNN
jgi:hypothetical protein